MNRRVGRQDRQILGKNGVAVRISGSPPTISHGTFGVFERAYILTKPAVAWVAAATAIVSEQETGIFRAKGEQGPGASRKCPFEAALPLRSSCDMASLGMAT